MAFVVIAIALLAGAVAVIKTNDLVHAVLYLAVVLMATAGAFVALEADFVAAVQVMLYTGGVITLMLFAVMLTERLEGSRVLVESRGWGRALLIGGGFFAIVAAAILQTELPGGEMLAEPDSQYVGQLFLTRHVAAFEALSALLLAAMIGAIVLARRKDA
ncbi:MAG: NADH-quinone oxidoreductase subunit J [Proteobacteria bacterium]|nr:NADH-quinone oxidoreductase subunit J [Pseudomonadota bacterium]MCP4915669.1 NADH-quinone oxidoreductase subunit J [Pseudomonadota bacterium]